MSSESSGTDLPGHVIEVEMKMIGSASALREIAEGQLVKQSATSTPREKHVINYYFDTPELLLRDAFFTLRVRGDGAQWVQSLKVRKNAVSGLFRREEWERTVVSSRPELHALPTGPAFEAIRRNLPNLREVFITRFVRTSIDVAWKQTPATVDTVFELSLDVGKIECD